ncbi:hypothetical protein HMPREF3145_00865 [Corynebacterium sp. HMSC05C01]|uniref:hypothetical protein n=1 Tax=Corynebacterium sp. HMSC05C01 TaxID=1581113 RepID=UPI0008A3535B|nr:hypothetical protein [Corynebacterium sp. HMSC05C01]OFT72725.1 hypothetical protein HMPREF3145_00865 [Corynebacterium sp. HMSC05C01]
MSNEVPLIHHRSVQSFLQMGLESGVHEIGYGGNTLDLMLEKAPSKNLLVIFHAAAGLSHTTPIFTGRKIAQSADASTLFVSDPSLDLGVRIGWFAGDESRPLQIDLPRVIQHVASSTDAERIIFFGPSAGGFASLYYSHMFPNSLSVAVNPQTAISRYYGHLAESYYSAAWPHEERRLGLVDDIVPLYQDEFTNYVFYMQNSQDDFHIKHHLRPWEEATSSSFGSRWFLLSDDWGDGHTPPPAFFLESILQFATTFEGGWDELIQSLNEEF